MPKLCALVIGHKAASPGAVNRASGLTEFVFNDELAQRIEAAMTLFTHPGMLRVQRVYRRTYASLPGDINELTPDFIVSLHCNAFDGEVSGTEMLYYHRSGDGFRLAKILQEQLVERLGLPDRGIKPKTAEDRGGYLLNQTNAPAVIAEPFFLDNDADLACAQKIDDGLAQGYAKAIALYGLR